MWKVCRDAQRHTHTVRERERERGKKDPVEQKWQQKQLLLLFFLPCTYTQRVREWVRVSAYVLVFVQKGSQGVFIEYDANNQGNGTRENERWWECDSNRTIQRNETTAANTIYNNPEGNLLQLSPSHLFCCCCCCCRFDIAHIRNSLVPLWLGRILI